MGKGKLIVIEGTDCSGKETQSNLLVKNLNLLGINSICLSFPMYNTPTGRIIGEAFLGKGKDNKSWFKEGSVKVDPKIASLYYAADRKYNFDIIKDYLEKGYYVIIDRYVSSNMAHQGAKIDDPEERFNLFNWIDKLEYWLLGLPKPDITFFLHMPYNYSLELMKNRNELDENEKDEEYQRNSIKAYLELSTLYGWKVINCIKEDELKSIEEINKEILDIVINSSKEDE